MGDVSLNLPARPEFLHVVRAVVSGVGARQGLSYDAINDLCLATSEAAAYLLGLSASEGRRLRVRMRAEGEIEVLVTTDAPATTWPPAAQRTLAWRVLAGLVDEVSFVVQDGGPAIRLLLSLPLERPGGGERA